MLPQHAQQGKQQHPAYPNTHDPSAYFNLEPSAAAKQMAALNAANMARMASRSVAPSAPYPAGALSSGPFHPSSQPVGNSNGHDPTSGSLPGPASSANIQPPNSSSNAHFADTSTSHANAPMAQSIPPIKQRQKNFLMGLANVMSSRNTPLPPQLTGIPYPHNYDPSNSPWKSIEPSSELGAFRLAGKDVELFKLWGIVFQAGGGNKLSRENAWSMILPHFDLPEQFQNPYNSQTSVAATLAQYYNVILQPFEDAYKRNVQEQQRKAMLSQQSTGLIQTSAGGPVPPRQPQVGPSGASGGGAVNMLNSLGQLPLNARTGAANGTTYQPNSHQTPPASHQRPQFVQSTGQGNPQVNSTPSMDPTSGVAGQNSHGVNGLDKNILELDTQGIKRKLEPDETDAKRVRQRTAESEPPENTSGTAVTPDRGSLPPPGPSSLANPQTSVPTLQQRPRSQPSRRKIEYVPLAREIEPTGGRDLRHFDEEVLRARRPLRDINDWGTIDIEALTMSIRSRLSVELSYALTTFTLLSTMRGQTQGSGFPIFQCGDLLDELLDLIEDEAFDDIEDTFDSAEDIRIVTHRELLNKIYEYESDPFAGLSRRQGSKDPDLGPKPRSADVVLTVLNIICNLANIPDNLTYLAGHERLLDVILRLCGIESPKDGSALRPTCPIFSLTDLIAARKFVLYIVTYTAGMIQFPTSATPSKITKRMAIRTFDLAASYLVDPSEAVSPLACVQQAGIPHSGYLKPPTLPDIALELFTRISQTDANREAFSKSIPQSSIWCLFVALVHRLPIVDADFQLATRELWLSYLEKNIMAIYSLAFLASPQLKQRVKTDQTLAFSKVMLRMVQKFLLNPSPDGRMWFLVCARRAIETMKVVDDSEDSFDTSESTVPTLNFGMGYGEMGESGTEKGTGLLGGHRDVTWDLLLLREVAMDDVMFAELDTLTRVE